MKVSLIPLCLLFLALPKWPEPHKSISKPSLKELPSKALELISGIGPVQSAKLKETDNWAQSDHIGPKTRLKLLELLNP